MFEHEARLYSFMLEYARLLKTGLDEDRWAEQPAPGLNPPAWTFGHLAVVADAGVALLGGEKALAPEWRKRHGPGSTLSTDRSFYPSSAELWAVYERGHERLATAALAATPEMLERSNTITSEFLKHALPTVGPSRPPHDVA